MNLYDEAIEELKCVWNGNDLSYPSKAIKALERAKKVEELLGLYRKAHPTVSVFNPYYNDLAKKEKELEELK